MLGKPNIFKSWLLEVDVKITQKKVDVLMKGGFRLVP
jgi:hypothetical protein